MKTTCAITITLKSTITVLAMAIVVGVNAYAINQTSFLLVALVIAPALEESAKRLMVGRGATFGVIESALFRAVSPASIIMVIVHFLLGELPLKWAIPCHMTWNLTIAIIVL